MHSLVLPNLIAAEKNKYTCPVKVIHQILYVVSSLLVDLGKISGTMKFWG